MRDKQHRATIYGQGAARNDTDVKPSVLVTSPSCGRLEQPRPFPANAGLSSWPRSGTGFQVVGSVPPDDNFFVVPRRPRTRGLRQQRRTFECYSVSLLSSSGDVSTMAISSHGSPGGSEVKEDEDPDAIEGASALLSLCGLPTSETELEVSGTHDVLEKLPPRREISYQESTPHTVVKKRKSPTSSANGNEFDPVDVPKPKDAKSERIGFAEPLSQLPQLPPLKTTIERATYPTEQQVTAKALPVEVASTSKPTYTNDSPKVLEKVDVPKRELAAVPLTSSKIQEHIKMMDQMLPQQLARFSSAEAARARGTSKVSSPQSGARVRVAPVSGIGSSACESSVASEQALRSANAATEHYLGSSSNLATAAPQPSRSTGVVSGKASTGHVVAAKPPKADSPKPTASVRPCPGQKMHVLISHFIERDLQRQLNVPHPAQQQHKVGFVPTQQHIQPSPHKPSATPAPKPYYPLAKPVVPVCDENGATSSKFTGHDGLSIPTGPGRGSLNNAAPKHQVTLPQESVQAPTKPPQQIELERRAASMAFSAPMMAASPSVYSVINPSFLQLQPQPSSVNPPNRPVLPPPQLTPQVGQHLPPHLQLAMMGPNPQFAALYNTLHHGGSSGFGALNLPPPAPAALPAPQVLPGGHPIFAAPPALLGNIFGNQLTGQMPAVTNGFLSPEISAFMGARPQIPLNPKDFSMLTARMFGGKRI